MPIKLIPPRNGFSPYYYGRGTHLGIFINKSTGTARPKLAKRVIKSWEEDIERGRFAKAVGPTFGAAVARYIKAGGDKRFVAKLVIYFGENRLLAAFDQNLIDQAAADLFPAHSAATRNREVYTPVSSILKASGIEFKLKRPKGSRGRELTGFLWPEQAAAIFEAAREIDREFAAFIVFLCYTGCRLSEGLKIKCEDFRLADAEAFVPTTKNGESRRVFLPPVVVAELGNHPKGCDRPGKRVFRFTKSGRLYKLLALAAKAAGVQLPEDQAFHVFRHTYGAWMRRFAGTDTTGLVATGAWKSKQAASRYEHAVVSEEARRATLLPVFKMTKSN